MRGPSFKATVILLSKIEILLVALGTWPVRDPRFVDTFCRTFWCTFCSQNVELVDSFVHFFPKTLNCNRQCCALFGDLHKTLKFNVFEIKSAFIAL